MKHELQEAQNGLREMFKQLHDLHVRIARQKRKVAMLTELARWDEDSQPVPLVDGITEACRTALLDSNKPLSPAEVRDTIKTLGVPKQQNLLASVHTILKRLAAAGEIKEANGLYRRLTENEFLLKGMPPRIRPIKPMEPGEKMHPRTRVPKK
jgi:hypothetical protein